MDKFAICGFFAPSPPQAVSGEPEDGGSQVVASPRIKGTIPHLGPGWGRWPNTVRNKTKGRSSEIESLAIPFYFILHL